MTYLVSVIECWSKCLHANTIAVFKFFIFVYCKLSQLCKDVIKDKMFAWLLDVMVTLLRLLQQENDNSYRFII